MTRVDSPPRQKVIALTRYARLGASSRLRMMQFQESLRSFNIDLQVTPLFSDDYLQSSYRGSKKRLFLAIRDILKRIYFCLANRSKPGIYWVEKELVPYLPYFFERKLYASGGRYVVDIDDAIFHQYDMNPRRFIQWALGDKLKRVFQRASAVTAGNSYLAAYAVAAGCRDVRKVPTVVDIRRYSPKSDYSIHEPIKICWIGSPATVHYLPDILGILSELQREFPLQLVIIGATLPGNTFDFIEFKQWSESQECELIRECDVGIMPIKDSPWERGKCGYKLIQYMACGLPVVASAVGANLEIVRDGVDGYLVSSDDDWKLAIRTLTADAALRQRLGVNARQRAEETYSVQAVSQVIASSLLAQKA